MNSQTTFSCVLKVVSPPCGTLCLHLDLKNESLKMALVIKMVHQNSPPLSQLGNGEEAKHRKAK